MIANAFTLKAWLRQIFSSLKGALFPARCISCGIFFDLPAGRPMPPAHSFKNQSAPAGAQNEIFKWALAPFICPACFDNFSPVGPPLCSRCGLMFQSREGHDHLCGDCSDKPGRFRKARAFGVYDQALMEAIHRFKYKGKLQLARPLGTLLLASLMAYWGSDPPDLVAPVPLHDHRFRQRGFNQAYLLIREWPQIAAALPLEMPDIVIAREALLRIRRTEPQTGLGRRTRLQNIKNAFAIGNEDRVAQKKILLVDDVYTTGATVEECARVLLNAGAEWVDVLTLARTM